MTNVLEEVSDKDLMDEVRKRQLETKLSRQQAAEKWQESWPKYLTTFLSCHPEGRNEVYEFENSAWNETDDALTGEGSYKFHPSDRVFSSLDDGTWDATFEINKDGSMELVAIDGRSVAAEKNFEGDMINAWRNHTRYLPVKEGGD